MPSDFLYMYYNFYDNVLSFPEIAFYLPLNKLLYDEINNIYQITGKNSLGIETNYSISRGEGTFSVTAPLNFKHLFLLSPNKKYSDSFVNINEYIDLTPPENSNISFVYDLIEPSDYKALVCKEGYYLQHSDKKCYATCDSEKYIQYPGVNKKRGLCDYYCDVSMTCDNQYNDYNNFCRNTNDYYNLYYNCLDEEKEYDLFYSGKYTPGTFEIPINPYLTNYIIDFWIYIDLSIDSFENFGNDIIRYLFYSNTAKIYQKNNVTYFL